jgi:phenylacetate-CoA ligase
MDIRKAILLLNGFPVNSASEDLLKIRGYNSEEIESYQQKMKWEIAKFHYNNNSFYKKIIGNVFPDNWNDLPILSKADFQGNLNGIISNGFKIGDLYKSNTSGSGGHPFTFVKDKYCHARTWAFILNRYRELGITETSKEARFYGIPLEFKPKMVEYLKDFVFNRRRFPVFDLSERNLEFYLERLAIGNFNYIYGYTNSIFAFCQFLQKKKIILNELCPSLKLIVVTSELCLDFQRELIENVSGLKVVSEYGASEFGYIGKEIEPNIWEVVWQNIFMEQNPVEHNNNDYGELLITDFFNKSFPFIRYSIGDLGKIKNRNGVPHIYNLVGRTNDMAILPSGKKSPGLTFYYISRSVLEKSGVLKEFIVRQTKLNEFWIDYKGDEELSSASIELIKNKFEEYLEPGLIINFRFLNEIPRTKKGKLKHFYSELNGAN